MTLTPDMEKEEEGVHPGASLSAVRGTAPHPDRPGQGEWLRRDMVGRVMAAIDAASGDASATDAEVARRVIAVMREPSAEIQEAWLRIFDGSNPSLKVVMCGVAFEAWRAGIDAALTQEQTP